MKAGVVEGRMLSSLHCSRSAWREDEIALVVPEGLDDRIERWKTTTVRAPKLRRARKGHERCDDRLRGYDSGSRAIDPPFQPILTQSTVSMGT